MDSSPAAPCAAYMDFRAASPVDYRRDCVVRKGSDGDGSRRHSTEGNVDGTVIAPGLETAHVPWNGDDVWWECCVLAQPES